LWDTPQPVLVCVVTYSHVNVINTTHWCGNEAMENVNTLKIVLTTNHHLYRDNSATDLLRPIEAYLSLRKPHTDSHRCVRKLGLRQSSVKIAFSGFLNKYFTMQRWTARYHRMEYLQSTAVNNKHLLKVYIEHL
jgi:hypothetical protein